MFLLDDMLSRRTNKIIYSIGDAAQDFNIINDGMK